MDLTKKQYQWLKRAVDKCAPPEDLKSCVLMSATGFLSADRARSHQIGDFFSAHDSNLCDGIERLSSSGEPVLSSGFKGPAQDLYSLHKPVGSLEISGRNIDLFKELSAFSCIEWDIKGYRIKARTPFFGERWQTFVPRMSKESANNGITFRVNPKFLVDAIGIGSDYMNLSWEKEKYGMLHVASYCDGVETKALIMPMRTEGPL